MKKIIIAVALLATMVQAQKTIAVTSIDSYKTVQDTHKDVTTVYTEHTTVHGGNLVYDYDELKETIEDLRQQLLQSGVDNGVQIALLKRKKADLEEELKHKPKSTVQRGSLVVLGNKVNKDDIVTLGGYRKVRVCDDNLVIPYSTDTRCHFKDVTKEYLTTGWGSSKVTHINGVSTEYTNPNSRTNRYKAQKARSKSKMKALLSGIILDHKIKDIPIGAFIAVTPKGSFTRKGYYCKKGYILQDGRPYSKLHPITSFRSLGSDVVCANSGYHSYMRLTPSMSIKEL